MNLLRKNISIFLIFVLVFYIVPKEFVHACFDHEDTTDYVASSPDSKAPLTIGIQHIHCELLNFETDVFHSADLVSIESPQGVFFSFLTVAPHAGDISSPAFIALRGPPLC